MKHYTKEKNNLLNEPTNSTKIKRRIFAILFSTYGWLGNEDPASSHERMIVIVLRQPSSHISARLSEGR